MTNNWKESPTHLDLLAKFKRGKDITKVMEWQYLRETLGETAKKAIDRFIAQGMLIPCTVEETIGFLMTVAEIKPLLKERNLKMSGKKAELVARLKDADPKIFASLASGHRHMKCSPDAISILADFEEQMLAAESSAKERMYEALMRRDVAAAYKVFIIFQRQFRDSNRSPNDFEAERLQNVMNTCPASLAHLDSSSLQKVQCAVALTSLWYGEKAQDWIMDPIDDTISIDRAIAHIGRAAEFGERVQHGGVYQHPVRVVFSPYDLDSCKLCKVYDGQEIEMKDFPNLPLAGCSSETGCMCKIEYVWETDQLSVDVDVDLDDLGLFEPSPEEDVVERLGKLKELLNSELISQEEYDTKKAQILRDL